MRTIIWRKKTAELKTARGHDAFAVACVMDSPALRTQRAVRRPTVKFVKPFSTWQHRFDVDQIFCRMLIPCPWYNFVQNIISLFVSDSVYSPEFHLCSVQYSCDVATIYYLCMITFIWHEFLCWMVEHCTWLCSLSLHSAYLHWH